MTTYIWRVTDMNRQSADGLVFAVHWLCTAYDGARSVSSYGLLPLTRGPSFVPYDKLTEARVLGWVRDKLDTAAIEANLQAQLTELANPPTLTGVPW